MGAYEYDDGDNAEEKEGGEGIITHRAGANEGVLRECRGLLLVTARAVNWQRCCVAEDGRGARVLGGVLEGCCAESGVVEVVAGSCGSSSGCGG